MKRATFLSFFKRDYPATIRYIFYLCVRFVLTKKIQLLFSMRSKQPILKAVQGGPKVVVSLTSFPYRFKRLHLCLESLLRQTVKPDVICLWLAEDEIAGIELPKTLSIQEQRGVTIKFCKENLRPYNKLLHSIKEFPTAAIVTVDDDTIYKRDLLAQLLYAHERHPMEIIANMPVVMKKSANKKLQPHKEWEYCTREMEGNQLFPIGSAGVLYPPNALSEEVHNTKVLKELSPHHDDAWFKAMSLIQNTKVRGIAHKPYNASHRIWGTQKIALWRINTTDGTDDEQLKKIFDHYNLYSKID